MAAVQRMASPRAGCSPWLVRLTLATLTLPFLLFFLGWLRPWVGVPLALGMLWSCGLVARDFENLPLGLPRLTDRRGMFAVSLLLAAAWVLLSGAGGFFFQTEDYYLHNGRLRDLILQPWPVIYDGDRPLVYYSAYYLPNALVGKVVGFDLAYRLMALWTFLLVAIAFAWLFTMLGGVSLAVVLSFVAFSGIDAIGVLLFGFPVGDQADVAEWWAFEDLFYIAYQSFTFQLFWAPHQVIAGWILTPMLVCAAMARSRASLLFLLSLTCFWSPFLGLALGPFVAFLLLQDPRNLLRDAMTWQNGYGLLVAAVFLAYYVSGSATSNPRGWIWEATNVVDPEFLVRLLFFYALEFAVFAWLAWPVLRSVPSPDSRCMLFGLAMLAAMPAYRYGLWNDLLVRGVVPYLWILFWMIHRFLQDGPTGNSGAWRRPALVAALLVAALTPLASFRHSFANADLRRAPVSPADHAYATQFLGRLDTVFFRYLARPP